MNSEVADQIRAFIQYLEKNKRSLTIDGDIHPSNFEDLPDEIRTKLQNPNYYHGRPISVDMVLREMKMAKVDMALIWQNPSVTSYGSNKTENFEKLLLANRFIAETASKYKNKFIPGGWTDPKALGIENALKLVDICIFELGMPIVKMNPAQNAYPIDSDYVLTVLDHIVECGATPAFHFGGDSPFTPAEGLERVAMRHPEHPVLAVHMGGGGSHYVDGEALYQATRELGLRRPNIRFVLSAKRDTHMESDLISYMLAGEPFCHNLCCGSDAPYGKITWNFGGFRLMFESLQDVKNHPDARVRENPGLFSDEAIQLFLGGNLAELVILSYKNVLRRSAKCAV